MTRLHADTLIVGAGCAGSSLACAMVQAGLHTERIVLIDARREHSHDRTWCYWGLHSHPFESAVRHRWSCWSVHHDGRELPSRAPGLAYEHVPSGAFYREALQRLEGKVELRLGVAVESVEDRGSHVRVRTHEGDWHAERVFDSRPDVAALTSPSVNEVTLLQHFVGWQVRVRSPVFDPRCVTLMDFDVDQDRGLRFVYVLPFSPHEALIEDTYLSAHPHAAEVYESGIRAYLHERWGVEGFEVLHRERGALPMSTAPLRQRASARVYRIGTAGGLLKPSTGYAFLAIQRHSRELAARLRTHRLPDPPQVRSSRATFMDRVFLAFLADHPDRAPELFFRMFERVPTRKLIRFLSDRGDARDALHVMQALPTRPMLRQALKSYPVWLRR